MTWKHEYLYSVVLHEVWMPKFITTDNEITQSNRRTEITKIPSIWTELCTILKNIELVALVPTDSINHTIQYIKLLLVDNSRLDNFWNYLNNTWLKKY
ncbi:hypothetical protein HZS_4815 [Henneguya salminicola]|nr:hypothetical protein HZS_4815 [Henneguya salminicola]